MTDPEHHPLIAWFGWWVLLALPAAIGYWRSRTEDAVPRWATIYRCVVIAGGLMVSVVAAVLYVVAMRSFVESPDFFHHVCFARDMLRVPALVPESCYRYAPGGYAFWRSVQRVWPDNLAAMQWSYLAALFANAVLVGSIVRRATGETSVAVYAGVWMMVLYSRFEGFSGIPEPLVTLPYLIGVLLWQGKQLAGRGGWKRMLALGLGLGFAVGTKQQGGLLALGAIALMMPLVFRTSEVRPDWRQLLVLPVVALFAVAFVMANEGRGLVPLEWGLRQVGSYPAHESFAANLWSQVRNDESLALAVFMTVTVWFVGLVTHRGRELLMRPPGQIVGFCLIGAIASTYQFTRRGYYHYSLIGLPAFVIATAIAGVLLFRSLANMDGGNRTFPARRELALWFAFLLASFPLFYTGGNPANLHVWRWTYDESFVPHSIWRFQSAEVAEDVATIAMALPPAAEMLVLPPRMTSLYYILDGQTTVYPNGYYWDPQPEMLRETIADWAVQYVVELHLRNRPGDDENWEAFECDWAVRMLPNVEFLPVLVTPTLTLWARSDNSGKMHIDDLHIVPFD